ncbi:MAG TPA: class I fructose-bisphosphate aldolase, partial [Kineobactrum sp.]
KPSMVTAGEDAATAAPGQVAEFTLRTLRRAVPVAVPSINFLSGGQAPAEATENLNALNQSRPAGLWQLSFSFARALQGPALEAWRGRAENVATAQAALALRARLNQLAMQGKYAMSMER